MRKIYKNRPINWAICITLSFALIFSSIAPIGSITPVKALAQGNTVVQSAPVASDPPSRRPSGRQQLSQGSGDALSDTPILAPDPQPTISAFSAEVQYSLGLLEGYEYFSELPEQDAEILCAAFKVNSGAMEELETLGLALEESLVYAQVEYTYGFPVGDMLENYPTQEECVQLRSEMRSYAYYSDLQGEGFDLDNTLKQYIFEGKTFQQVKKASELHDKLGISIENLLAEEYTSSKSTTSLTKTEKESFEAYALEVQLNTQALMEFAIQNNLTCDELQKQASGPQSQSTPGQMTATMGMAAAAAGALQPGEREAVPLNQIAAPYAAGNADNVNMNTGELTYQNVDSVIPGRNGLDLVIGRRYSSADANLFNPEFVYDSLGVNGYWNGSSFVPANYMFAVVWETYFLGSMGSFTLDELDQGPFAKVFTADEYSEYLDFLSDLRYDEKHPVSYPNFDGAGNTGILNTYILDYGTFPVYYWINNGKIQYFYRKFISEKKENTHLNNLYGLGNGWGFMFSSIETIGNTKILHLADGRSYTVNITATVGDSNLKDYTLTDLRLENDAGGYGGATYTLYCKDGKREHFDSLGRLIAIRDRYNNTITFAYTTQNNLPKITITDTLSRITTISGAAVTGGHIMTVTLPDSSTLKYTVNKLSNFWGGAQKGYALAQFQDQLNTATSYSYNMHKSQFNFIGKDKNNTALTYYFYDDENINCTGNETHTVYLKSITHPTSYRTDFTYTTKQAHNLGESGVRTSFAVKYRDTILNSTIVHRLRYFWDPNDYSGFPSHNPDSLPSGYTYSNCYDVHTGANNISSSYYVIFNNKHLPVKEYDEAYSSATGYNFHATKLFEYNADKLPTKITTKTYNPFSGSVYNPYDNWGTEPPRLESIVMYEYDNNTAVTANKKGNVTASWSPLANGNTANTEYKTTQTYDATYSLPLEKTYKQDANTTIIERNTVSGLNIIRQEVLVNNTVKSKTEFDYDSYGNITAAKRYKDGLSTYIQTNYTYQSNAYLSEIRNTGVLNSDGSSASGTPLQAAGTIVSKFAYNANNGRLTTSTDANNLATGYAYNAVGDLTTQTNPDNTTVTYTRNYAANTLTVKDENGAQVRYDYTPFGQEYEVRDVQSGTVLSRKTYDNLFRLSTEADLLNGATTTYLYDAFSRPSSVTVRNSSNTILAQESYAYDDVNGIGPFLRVQKTVLGEPNAPSIVTAQYTDKMGRVVQEGRVLGGTEYLDYFTYDYVGNKIQERLAYAVQKGLTYSAKWEYDFAGRVTKAYNADGGFTTSTYNALGQLVTATDFAGIPTTYTYDDIDRLLEEKGIVEQNGPTVYNSYKRHDYDPAGNITKTRTSNNQVGQATTWARTDYDYNNRGRLEYVTQYDGASIDNVTKYTYDGVGNTLTMRTGMSTKSSSDGQQTTYTYDRLGRMLTLKDPLNQQETYAYKNSGLGLLNTKTDRNGNVGAYSYDALGRVLSEQVTTPDNVSETNSYTYYVTGAKKTESNPTVTTTFVYDALGRLTQESESGGSGAVKVYSYDLANNRTGFSATRGGTTIHNTAYSYDNQNRLKTVSDNGSLKATYNYNANGARSSLVYANGTSEVYAYNNANWLTNLDNLKGSTVLSSYVYTYYADGNQRTKKDHNNRTTTYIYDGAGRLKSENESTGFGAAYQYDRFGNRTQMAVTGADTYTVAYSYDANNRLTQDVKTAGSAVTTGSYFYDPNGNQLAKASETLAPAGGGIPQVGIDPSGVELYDYDGFNRMVRSNVNGEEATYTYHANGLRNSKVTAAGTITHLWDGANIVADLNGGAVIARYVRGIGLLMSDAAGTQKFYLYNGHGDVVQLTGSTGTILWQYDYDAFGNERGIAGQDPALDANPFRYCAEYFDKETGTIYLRARYYNPVTSRMLSEDPIRDGLNWYIYAGNNPLFYIDPFGLAMVALREWFNKQMAYVSNSYSGTGYIGWNTSSRIATVSMTANGYSGYAQFAPGDRYGSYINNDTKSEYYGSLFVDDTLLWAVFGRVIDPPGLKQDWAANAVLLVGSAGIAYVGLSAVGVIGATGGITATAASGTGTVVIGETMSRVSNYANQINATVYAGLPNYNQLVVRFGSRIANFIGKVDNAKWLINEMAKNTRIIDIGIDLERAARSSSYAMEQILTFFYKNKEIVEQIVNNIRI